MRPLSFVMTSVTCAFAFAACAPRGGNGVQPTPEPTPLPAVTAAAAAPLPPWIASISPHGLAKDGAQIRIRFVNDVVPLEALESPDRAQTLAHLAIEPALPGRFVILTPRMIAFAADAPIPRASRVRVTLGAGLADRAGHVLARDYRWSFTTEPIVLTVPGGDAAPPDTTRVGRTPRIGIDANTELDAASLAAHVHLVGAKDGGLVATSVAPSPSPDPSAPPTIASDAAGEATTDRTFHYEVTPQRELAADTAYTIVVDPGVAPLAGNLPTGTGFRGRLQTYGALSFTGVVFDRPAEDRDDGNGIVRFTAGRPFLTFTNDIDPASLAKAVSIAPVRAPVTLASVAPGGRIALNAFALAPQTSYAVTISGGLTDTFGQKLGHDVTANFTTGDVRADLWAPTGLNIFPSGSHLAIDLAATNLPENAYQSATAVVAPADLIARDPESTDDVAKLLPPARAWTPHRVAGRTNVETAIALPLERLLAGPAGMLAYGFRAQTGARAAVPLVGAVQLTDIGVFAQWFPGGGIVRTHHLADGTTIANAHVEVYESALEADRKTPAPKTPCASGTTDAQGVWKLDAATFAACASTARSADAAPALLVVARAGRDWAYARTSSYGDGYANGLTNQGWSAGTPVSHGVLVSDRSLYQRGEKAQLLGVAYFDRNGTLGRGVSPAYEVTAQLPSGTTISLGRAAVDAYGAFSLAYTFAKRAEIGYWTLVAKGMRGEELDGSIRVAEFRPPNFKVDLALDRDLVTAGATVVAASTSTYLFGAPVEGGTSHVAVTRAREYFTPAGWETFSFGRTWTYPQREPYVPSEVVAQDLAIDAQGRAQLAVTVGSDLPFPMRYTVSAETTDVSHLAVNDTKSFVAVPSDALIGLRGRFVARAGEPIPTDVIVTDARGKPRTERRVRVTLQRRLDANVTQIVEGSESPHDAVRYVDVANVEVEPDERASNAQLEAPQSGEYRIRANFTDAKDDTTASDRFVWIAGSGEAAWPSGEGNALTVKLDKTSYRPGEVATALIESPYPDAELSLSVVRHGVLYASTRIVHGAAPQIAFTITPDMLPNAAVEAVLVRRGKALHGAAPPGLDKLARIGFAPFDVALDAKYVRVDVRPEHASLAPAARQRVRLHLSDRGGKPVRGEVALGVVNDAILQLSGYRFPDLVKTVYAEQPISTTFADNRAKVSLQNAQRSIDKGFGFGGGELPSAADTRVRHAFVPLAYWNASVRTDERGDAVVDFALPDDLTTWRIMALAATADARFGNGEATFVSTKALVTNPVLPQFARPGDRFAGGLALTNIARTTGDVDIAATISGGATFANGDAHVATLRAPANPTTTAYRFDIVAAGVRDASVTFRTRLGSHADAFAFPVPIVHDDSFENVVTTGTTVDRASVALAIGPALRGPLGTLEVTLASTLLADANVLARTLDEPREPFATVLASRIAIAADTIVLARTFGTSATPVPRKTLAEDLDALRALALPDGGFAPWPGAPKSEPFSTAFVAQALAQARMAGVDVDGDIARVRAYLAKTLADPPGCGLAHPVCVASVRLEATETLGALGFARDDFVSDIVAHERSLGYYERVELARFLLRLDDWRARGLALRDELLQQVALSARHATLDVRGAFGESEVAGQAQLVALAIASGMPRDDIDRLLRSLLSLRHDGRYGCTCDDAEAMNALVAYAAQESAPPNFTATAKVQATPAQTRTVSFKGYAKTEERFVLGLDTVAAGASDVALSKIGEGTLHYVVALRYRVPATSPGQYAGLRIDRIVRRAADIDARKAPLAQFGLAAPPVSTTLLAGGVFDVEDRIVTDHPVDNVVVTDPLPAGLEAVDRTFRIAAAVDPNAGDAWFVDFRAIERERVTSFVQHLDAGSYAIHYLVRSVTPGTFAWPGATASLQYAPEEFGRTAAGQLIVSAR